MEETVWLWGKCPSFTEWLMAGFKWKARLQRGLERPHSGRTEDGELKVPILAKSFAE
jgi:hypothetical protein